MEEILQNPKYIVTGVLILIALIVLIYFLLNSGNKYKLEGEYFMHPMKFIGCKILKTKNKDEFKINFKNNHKLVPYDSLNTITKDNPDLDSKTALIKMTGEKNPLGNELIYIENGINFTGVQLTKDYNLYADENDILILVNKDTRETVVFKKIDF